MQAVTVATDELSCDKNEIEKKKREIGKNNPEASTVYRVTKPSWNRVTCKMYRRNKCSRLT